MSFTETFEKSVCEGDTIDCTVKGFDINARIVRDDCNDAPEFGGLENASVKRFPEGRQYGFWPSLDPQAAGYIGDGPRPKKRFEVEHAHAAEIMQAWLDDQWFYCGIILSVSRAGVLLEEHAASLWGIEANYPESDNAYLNTVANELVSEAIITGHTALARLLATSPQKRDDDILFRTFTGNSAGWTGGVNNAALVGQDGASFSAIFDEDGAPVIIERRSTGSEGSSQILPSDPDFEEISIRLIRLWDAITSGTA